MSPSWCARSVVSRFGEAAVNAGYKVFTTLDGRLQTAANRALRLGLIEYDRRHGYRGALAKVKVPAGASTATSSMSCWRSTAPSACCSRPS